MKPKRLWAVGMSSLLAAGCTKDARLGPPLAPCTAASGDSVSQAYAARTTVDPTLSSGCAVFVENATGGAITYLLVAQSASARPNDSSTYWLRGVTLAAAAAAPQAPLAAAEPGAQLRFDLTMRQVERALALEMGPPPRQPAAVAPVAPAPPMVGNVRTFKVCGDTLCLTHPTVKATAKKVGDHIAIYVDSADITRGDTLDTSDLISIAAVFDTLLYPTDTAAFGRESDIDNNGRVIVLMTGKVNALAPSDPCTGEYIGGSFYPGDLIAGFKNGNHAEIFYSISPDPNGDLSCVSHSASEVKNNVPPTFIHEFQHMISFNQHSILRRGKPEQLWLNEGLSHYAEELGGRQVLPGDSATFCNYLFGDLSRSFLYFANPQSAFLVDNSVVGSLQSRGAYWLFVRFLVDRFATDTSVAAANVVTLALDTTALTGAANVAHATGTAFATLVQQWGLANYLSDLSGFPTPPEWQYRKWRFRTGYPTLRNRCLFYGSFGFPSAYPLVPTSVAGDALDLSGVLRAGSGPYVLAQQAAGDPGFTLLFSDGSGRALRTGLAPRLNVIRIQ